MKGRRGYNKLVRMQGGLQNVRMRIRGKGGHFFTKNCVRTKWMTPYSDLLLFPYCNITAYK